MGLFGLQKKSIKKHQNVHEGSVQGQFVRDSCFCFKEFYDREDKINDAENESDREKFQNEELSWNESEFHRDPPCSDDRVWAKIQEIIDQARRSGTEELDIGRVLGAEDYSKLRTIPSEIGALTGLKKLVLYGSNISYLPREIGNCENLVEFLPYTSYRLHWFPFEITQCKNLRKSCVSTRAIYGNYKLRTPFPDLSKTMWDWGIQCCSVCGKNAKVDQYWVSQCVATDVLPLLVSVCGDSCLAKVGCGADGYVTRPHKGGLGIRQPDAKWM